MTDVAGLHRDGVFGQSQGRIIWQPRIRYCTFSERELLDCVEKVIGLFAPRLVLGISDELSSIGDIRLVGKMVEQHNGRMT